MESVSLEGISAYCNSVPFFMVEDAALLNAGFLVDRNETNVWVKKVGILTLERVRERERERERELKRERVLKREKERERERATVVRFEGN